MNADPEIAYFVSSLAVWEGQTYLLVQHPGTPLLVLGTVIMAAAAAVVPSAGGVPATLVGRPDLFIVPAHFLLLGACLAVVLALGWKTLAIRRPSDAVLAAAVAASYFAFLPDGFRWAFYWSHNAIAFPAGTALWLVVLAAQRRGRPVTTRTALCLGLAGGALAATQLFFATWVVGIAVAVAAVPLMRDGRREAGEAARLVLAVVAGSTAGFALCFIPALGGAQVFVDFISAVTSHQGRYGAGPPGFASAAVLRANLATLWGYAPLLFVAQILVVGALLFALSARGSEGSVSRGWRAAALGLSVQWILTVLVLAAHPSPFYVPALAALLPPLLAIAFAAWRRRGRSGRMACLLAAAAVCAGCAFGLTRSIGADARRNAFRAAVDHEVGAYRARVAGARGVRDEDVLLLWGPGVADAGCYALWMGTQYSNGALAHEVSRICPSEGLVWSNEVVLPEGWSARQGAPAVIVTTEAAPRLFPAFAAFGSPDLGADRNPEGLRLAFFPVTLDGGRIVAPPRPEAPALREVP